MVRKYRAFMVLAALILIAAALGLYWLSDSSKPPQFQLAKAVRRDIKMTVNTNGIIEPVDRTQIYSPIDGFVKAISVSEGAEIVQGQIFIRLEAQQIRTDLSEAKANLLEARRETQIILDSPPKEEVSAVNASIKENSLKLDQLVKNLQIEESLRTKGATSQEAVDKLRDEKNRLQLNLESLKEKKQDLSSRYSEKEKELADLQSRIDAFKTKAQQDLQGKQQELLQPFIVKAKDAVKDVAKENKYTTILNSIEDVVLYSEPGDDIMALVKKKLGIQ